MKYTTVMKTTKYILTLLLTVWCAVGNLYAVDKSYYDEVNGKSGTTLRQALTTLTYTKHTTDLGYNWTFDGIDVVNGEVLDMYSNCAWTPTTDQCGSITGICGCYNREHLVPQSLFNEAYPQKSDRHHLFLTDGKVNGMRSSYPFGETNTTTGFSSVSNGEKALGKLGASSSGYTGTVYEPADEAKGDIARAVMYMAIRYATADVCKKYGGSANSYPVTTWSNAMFSKDLSKNYGLSDNAVAVFLKWHRADPPSAKEIARNNGVEKKQGNRNPFIDLPDLVEYLWGNKAGQTVDLSSLNIATGGGSVPTTYEVTLNRNGATETVTRSGTYTLPTSSTEANACDGWAFAGWTTSSSYSNTTAPSYTTSVTGATTLYAVYSHTESTNAPIRKTPAAAGATMWAETWTGATTATSGSNSATPSANYGKGTTVYNSGTVTYTQSENTVYVRNEELAGGSKPELMLSSGKTWTISDIPTGEAEELTLTYASNNTKSSVSCSTTGASISGSSKSYTITTGGASTITLVFSCSGNTRIDDVSLTVKTAGSGSGSGGTGSTTTYKTTPDCGSAHTITLNNGGSVTGQGTFEASATSAYKGATITLYADPSDGYTFGSWTVTKAGGGAVEVTDNQFTMPDANVTVSATFTELPKYDIKFYNNGTPIGSTQSVYQGGTPNIPSVEPCEGYTFVGWWTETLATDNTASKSWIEDFTVTKAQNYYAIFSKTEGGGGNSGGKVTITPSTTGVPSAYAAEAECTLGSYKYGIKQMYKNNGTMQWRASTNSAGAGYMYNKDKYPGKISSVVITYNSSDANKNFTVKVGSTANPTGGTSITPTNSGSVYTYDCSSANADYFVLTNGTGAGYLDNIDINYAGGGTTYYTSTTEGCAAACTQLDAPDVTATAGNGQITLTWADVTGADHYTVTISKGDGYTTECGNAATIGTITQPSSGSNQCIITGLTNGLEYTTNVVANASSAACDSDADTDTATPQDCTPWDDPTLSWGKYSLNTTTDKTTTKTLTGTTHGTLSFESSNTDVLTVDGSTGAVTAVGSGEATIRAHWTADGDYCEKTMTSETFEVAGPLTISFDANGGTETMTAQTVTYKVSTAIKDNAFKREGYTFIGWATSADGEKVYNDKQSVAFTNSLTLYAKWQLNSHTVSFTSSIPGATVKVNGQTTNQIVNYGETVTVHIAPADHYTINTVSIEGATTHTAIVQTGSGETRTFTMPDENVTVEVTMTAESQYTAKFYNGDTQFGETKTGYADDDINAPATNPVSCDADEFTFVGWVAAEQISETTTKPEVLTFPQTMPVGNVSFYALYRRVVGSGGGEASVTFKTASSDGSTAYTDDSDIKANLVESYSGIESFEGSKAYSGKSGVKLGASGGTGYIKLNLSSPITTNTITVHAAKYGTDTGDLQIEVNGSNSFGSALSPADEMTFTNGSDVEIEDLTISTTSKRAYVASISLGGGGTSYYTTSPVCTPCEHKVTLTKGAETNGTFTLSQDNGEYDNCKSNFTVTVSNITPATGYRFKNVTATGGTNVAVSGPDGSGNYAVNYAKGNSVTSTITVHFEEIPSHTVTWSANGNTSNTASYKEGAAITFPPSATGCDGMEFKGWSAVEVEPQDYAPEYTTSATMGTEDITFYAVFATASSGSGGEEGWSETAITDLTSSDIFVIVGNNGSNYAMTNDNGTGSAPAATGLTVSDGKITSTVSDNLKWKISGNATDGYVFYPNGSTNTWLYCTATNNGVRVGTNNSKTFTIDGGYLKHSGTSRYVGVYNSSDWRCYTSNTGQSNIAGQSFKFYKYSAGSGSTTYSGYTTSCTPCEKQVNIVKGSEVNGSYALSLTGEQDNCHSAGLVVSVTDITATGDYQFKEITQEGIATGVTIDNDAKTVTYAKDVTGTSTITVVFEPKPTYMVRFFDNGTKVFEQEVVEGKTFTKPSNPAGCEGYEFQGWWASELAETNTTAYSWLNSFGAVYSNQTYHAVFKHVDGDSSGAEGEYTLKNGDESGSFTIISGVTGEFEQNDGQNPPVWNTNAVRAYSKNSLTITSSVGNLTSISFTFASGEGSNSITASTGTYSSGSWSGDAASVTFTIGGTSGHRRFQTITVGGAGTTYYTTETDCRSCSEPTIEFGVTTVNKFDGDAPFKITPNITGNTMGATVSYSSSNPTKAEVGADGTVTIHDAMSNEPITITATLAKVDDGVNCQKKVTATYTLNIYNKVTWLVNGSEYTTGAPTPQTTEGGQITTYPTDPVGADVCGGKTFMGWTTAEYEEKDTPPTPLYTGLSTMSSVYITQSTTYYAVFAEENSGESGGGQSTTYEFTITSDDFTSSSYADNNGEHTSTATDVMDANNSISVTWTSNQVYSSSGMQWQKSNGYIYNNTDLGKINSVTVTASAGSFTTYYGATVHPISSTSLGANDGFFNIETGSSVAGKTSAVTVNFTTSSSGGGSVTTYSAYSTSCGLCMPKPEITSTVIKSDNATITWKAVTDATGYEFTCSGGTVKVTGTTATITGLTPLSNYTYSVTAQGGAPYTCFRTTNGNFTTPDCDDVPYDITVTPYNVVQAIIRWKAEAESAKIVVYSDEACTHQYGRDTIASSPCTISGLKENTQYWFKVFGGESQDCASSVQTFLTQTTAVELVEWRDTAIIILLTGDETTASVLLEGKDDLHHETTTSYADSIFFSKYFEAASNTKLLAVFNGTDHNVNIADYKLAVAQSTSIFEQTSFDDMRYYTSNGGEASFTDEQMNLAPGSEMILITYQNKNSADSAIIKCAQENPNSHFENYYRLKSPSLQFNGDDAIALVNPQGYFIDLIGAGNMSGKNTSHVDETSQSGASGGTYHGFMDKPGGWYNTKGYHAMSDGTDTANYALSTNRCLLIRRNHVKSGLTAVERNTEDFVTLGDYTYLGENYEGEWKGVQIPGAGCEDGNCEGVTSACGQFDHVGSYDYQDYYASFEPVDTIENLTKNDDGTITIPIPGLDTMSCSMLRVNVYDTLTGDLKASREYRVPIIIQKGDVKSTDQLFTKHGKAVCKECDVLVYSGAKLIKNNSGEDRDTIGNLTLYPGSTLELPSGKGDYHVKSLTYRVEGDSVPVTKLNADLYTETQRLIVTRRIKNDRYYFISFPYDVNVNEITLANGNQAVNGKDFRLMEYDAEARAAEGSLQGAPGHWKLFTGDKLEAGRGYAIAVNTKAMKEILFPMTLDRKNLTNAEHTKKTNTVDINEYVGAARNTNHNWNLIAHPYITKFEVTAGATPGTTNVGALWENPSRENTGWIDDWKTWEEEDPTQPTDTTTTQPTDTTETHIGEIVESGTTEGGIVWVLYADGSMELTGSGQMGDFTSLDAVPWAQHRQFIKDLKIGGDVQKIGKYAFGQCTNLTNVIIAAPVTNLASQAFAGCTGLRTFRIEYYSEQHFVSATTTTFDGITDLSIISLYVPQSMYSRYSAQTPWSKMAISAFNDTGNAPRRATEEEDRSTWKESPGGIYVTIPVFRDGKVEYDQYWINEVTDIKPFTAVFIQGDGKGEMTFNMYPSGGGAPKRRSQADRCETRDHTVFVGLTINGNGQKDKTSLRLRPDFNEEYKFNLDLLKFTVFNTPRPQIYFKTPNEQLAYRAVSDSLAASTWLPVGVYCRDAGEYTFSLYDRYVWDEVEAVYLRDNVTGVETNLLMGNYTITTTGQIYTNTRFAVKVLLRRKVKDTPTMIDHTEDPNAPRKLFRDGLLYILRDGKVYDMTGKPVQFDDLLNR